MRQTYRLEFDELDPINVIADARDLRMWEAEYGQSWLISAYSHTQAAQLAYLAGKRMGVLGMFATYKDFDAHCITVSNEPAESALIGDPTPPDPTDAFSAA